jgi:preprotein translocase subunit SecA
MAARLPPFWSGPRRREEIVVVALTAKELYLKGDDYIVKDGQVVIVDRSTGRILPGRQWQMGIHQAVEAKEHVDTTSERRTTSRVSYQQFFQRYERLSGMTGTAMEVADELWTAYRLPVVRIPTHRPVIRTRAPDRYFETESQKFEAVADRVAELHRTGRPVLVGTRSVLSSERLGAMLSERGIQCNILNATREAEEAEIVARAGQRGAVTVATNMAGRGTDIKLGEGVCELGGLLVIATERHDESRVDRQLFGRAGRQGDPGAAEAFASLDDQLIANYGFGLLVGFVRRLVGPARTRLAGLLWKQAQWAAGKRHKTARAQVAAAESWMDAAFHHRSR